MKQSSKVYKAYHEDPQVVRSFRGHKNEVSCLAIHPDMKQIMSGSLDSTIHLWSFKPDVRPFHFVDHKVSPALRARLLSFLFETETHFICGFFSGWKPDAFWIRGFNGQNLEEHCYGEAQDSQGTRFAGSECLFFGGRSPNFDCLKWQNDQSLEHKNS